MKLHFRYLFLWLAKYSNVNCIDSKNLTRIPLVWRYFITLFKISINDICQSSSIHPSIHPSSFFLSRFEKSTAEKVLQAFLANQISHPWCQYLHIRTMDMSKKEKRNSSNPSLLVQNYLNRDVQRPITSPWHTNSALNSDPSRVR